MLRAQDFAKGLSNAVCSLREATTIVDLGRAGKSQSQIQKRSGTNVEAQLRCNTICNEMISDLIQKN